MLRGPEEEDGGDGPRDGATEWDGADPAMAQMHAAFLDDRPQDTGGFFGTALHDSSHDFVLEEGGAIDDEAGLGDGDDDDDDGAQDMLADLAESAAGLDLDFGGGLAPLELDASTQRMLDEDSSQKPPATKAPLRGRHARLEPACPATALTAPPRACWLVLHHPPASHPAGLRVSGMPASLDETQAAAHPLPRPLPRQHPATALARAARP